MLGTKRGEKCREVRKETHGIPVTISRLGMSALREPGQVHAWCSHSNSEKIGKPGEGKIQKRKVHAMVEGGGLCISLDRSPFVGRFHFKRRKGF